MSDGRKRKEGEKQVNKAGQSQRITRRMLGGAIFDLLESRMLLSATVDSGALLRRAEVVENHPPTEAASGLLPFGAIQITPLTITYEDILTATNAQDVDVETLSFVITNIPSGSGTLVVTHGGTPSPAAVGMTIVTGDTLTWTPSAAVKGQVNAFTVEAEDPELNLAANVSNILVTTAALPEVSITTTAGVIWESKAGTNVHQGKIVLKRTGNLSQPLQMMMTLGGTAVLGTNYTVTYTTGGVTQSVSASPTAITFPVNVGSITLMVNALEDNIADPTLTAQLTVTPDPNAAEPSYVPNPAATTAAAAIIDSNPTLTITANSGGILEGASNQKGFIITRKAAPGGNLNNTTSVNLNFTGGTFNTAVQLTGASVNGTVNGLDGTQTLLVTFAPGQSQKTVKLTTTNNNSANGTQTIVGTVSAAPGSTLAAPQKATLNVTDASATVNITSVNATANEMTGTPGEFLITRTGPITSALTVNITNSTGSGFAVLGVSDRIVSRGQLITTAVTIPANRRAVEVFVYPIDDHINDSLKATITLAANGTSYDVGTANSMTVTITNNDRAPIVAVPSVLKVVGRNSSIILTYADLVSLMGAALGKGESKGVLKLTVSAINIGTLELLAKGASAPTVATTSTTVSAGDSLIWNSSASSENYVTAFTLGAADGTVAATAGQWGSVHNSTTGTTNFVVYIS